MTNTLEIVVYCIIFVSSWKMTIHILNVYSNRKSELISFIRKIWNRIVIKSIKYRNRK